MLIYIKNNTIIIFMNIETFYNIIADEFDKTRVRLWSCVVNFLNSFSTNSKILDIGCGNGKYFSLCNNFLSFNISNIS